MQTTTLTMLEEALGMFVYLGIELTLLFLVISFIVGVIQEYLPSDKIQNILSSKSGKGYFSAAILGSLTPFCSCSTIPMLTGLLKARAGFGPTITFLFTSPLLNPIIIGLLWVTFGAQVTITYGTIAVAVSVSAAYSLEKFGFGEFVKPEVYGEKATYACATKPSSCSESLPTGLSCDTTNKCGSNDVAPSICCDGSAVLEHNNHQRWIRIWNETWRQFKTVLPFLLLGITIGAITYGFMPTDLVVKYAGPDNALAIPISAFIGVPLYIRAETVIPLASALAAKGMGMGAIMALIIGSAGASLTEVILLRSMFKGPMIVAFLSVIFGMAILAGFLFRFFF